MNLQNHTRTMRFLMLAVLIFICTQGITWAQSLDDAPAGYYKHPDPETTAILNFKSGQQKLPPDIRAEAEIKTFIGFIFYLEHHANEYTTDSAEYFAAFRRKVWDKYIAQKTSEDFLAYRQSDEYADHLIEAQYYVMFHDKPSTDMLGDLLKSNFFSNAFAFNPDSIKCLSRKQIGQILAEDMTNLKEIEAEVEYSRGEFEASWRIHQEHGSPKIRFSEEFSARLGFGSRAYYCGDDNTIYLGVKRWRQADDTDSDWMAELAHSDQFKRYGRQTMYDRHVKENAFLDSLVYYNTPTKIEDDDWQAAYGQAQHTKAALYDQVMYSKSDSLNGFPTIEHEGHYVIQPELEKEYKRLKKEISETLEMKEVISDISEK